MEPGLMMIEGGYSDTFRINLVLFRTFRGSASQKQETNRELFLEAWYS